MTEMLTLMQTINATAQSAAREFSCSIDDIKAYMSGERTPSGHILRALRSHVRLARGDKEGSFNAFRFKGEGLCWPCIHQEGVSHKGTVKGYHRHAKRGVKVSMCEPEWDKQEMYYK